MNGGINTYGYVGGNPVNNTDTFGLINDNSPTVGLPPKYAKMVNERFFKSTSPSAQAFVDFNMGTGLYIRGQVRNINFLYRKSGLAGQCEKALVELEEELLKEALSNPQVRDKIVDIVSNYAKNNKALVSGRMAGNVVVNGYVTRGRGGVNLKLVTGSSLATLATHGDVRALAQSAVKSGLDELPIESIIEQALLGNSELYKQLNSTLECICEN